MNAGTEKRSAEPRGHDADDTLVPAVSGQDDGVSAQFGPLLQNVPDTARRSPAQ